MQKSRKGEAVAERKRLYICHTFYHVYVTCLKEFHFRRQGQAAETTLWLSTLSNNFGDLQERAVKSGLFAEVHMYDEQPETAFPELAPLKENTGSAWGNLKNRIRFCKRLGELEKPFLPADLKTFDELYVFCDSDPIGYVLNREKVRYHAVEDGLNCLRYFDAARFDNRDHFTVKKWLAKTGLIFIQNGYGRYCIDMEVNDISALEYPCEKYVELPRRQLVEELTAEEKETLLSLFLKNREKVEEQLAEGKDMPRVLLLSEPLCDLETRKRIFADLLARYGEENGKKSFVMIKQHPRDGMDYGEAFPDVTVLGADFPMEMLNFMEGLYFDKVVSVYTVVDQLQFVGEKIMLGHDFMDLYEDPKVHRKNEQI